MYFPVPVTSLMSLSNRVSCSHMSTMRMKVRSSSILISLATQQQPGWLLKAHSQSHFPQGRAPVQPTGDKGEEGGRGGRGRQRVGVKSCQSRTKSLTLHLIVKICLGWITYKKKREKLRRHEVFCYLLHLASALKSQWPSHWHRGTAPPTGTQQTLQQTSLSVIHR